MINRQKSPHTIHRAQNLTHLAVGRCEVDVKLLDKEDLMKKHIEDSIGNWSISTLLKFRSEKPNLWYENNGIENDGCFAKTACNVLRTKGKSSHENGDQNISSQNSNKIKLIEDMFKENPNCSKNSVYKLNIPRQSRSKSNTNLCLKPVKSVSKFEKFIHRELDIPMKINEIKEAKNILFEDLNCIHKKLSAIPNIVINWVNISDGNWIELLNSCRGLLNQLCDIICEKENSENVHKLSEQMKRLQTELNNCSSVLKQSKEQKTNNVWDNKLKEKTKTISILRNELHFLNGCLNLHKNYDARVTKQKYIRKSFSCDSFTKIISNKSYFKEAGLTNKFEKEIVDEMKKLRKKNETFKAENLKLLKINEKLKSDYMLLAKENVALKNDNEIIKLKELAIQESEEIQDHGKMKSLEEIIKEQQDIIVTIRQKLEKTNAELIKEISNKVLLSAEIRILNKIDEKSEEFIHFYHKLIDLIKDNSDEDLTIDEDVKERACANIINKCSKIIAQRRNLQMNYSSFKTNSTRCLSYEIVPANDSHKDKLSVTMQQLKTVTEEKRKLENDYRVLEKFSTKQGEDLEKANGDLSFILEQTKNMEDYYESQYEDFKKDIAFFSQNEQKLYADIKEIENKYRKLENIIEMYSNELKSVLSEYNKDVGLLININNRIQHENKNYKQMYENKEEELTLSQNEIDRLQAKVRELSECIENLEQTKSMVQEQKIKISQLNDEFSNVNEHVTKLEDNCKTLNETNNKLNKKREEEYDFYKENLYSVKKKFDEYKNITRNELESFKNEKTKMFQHYAHMKENLDKLKIDNKKCTKLLLTSVKLLIDERVSRQNLEVDLNMPRNGTDIKNFETDKLLQVIDQLLKEKDTFQLELFCAVTRSTHLETKIAQLETQLEQVNNLNTEYNKSILSKVKKDSETDIIISNKNKKSASESDSSKLDRNRCLYQDKKSKTTNDRKIKSVPSIERVQTMDTGEPNGNKDNSDGRQKLDRTIAKFNTKHNTSSVLYAVHDNVQNVTEATPEFNLMEKFTYGQSESNRIVKKRDHSREFGLEKRMSTNDHIKRLKEQLKEQENYVGLLKDQVSVLEEIVSKANIENNKLNNVESKEYNMDFETDSNEKEEQLYLLLKKIIPNADGDCIVHNY